jgi:hypothetical protein
MNMLESMGWTGGGPLLSPVQRQASIIRRPTADADGLFLKLMLIGCNELLVDIMQVHQLCTFFPQLALECLVIGDWS